MVCVGVQEKSLLPPFPFSRPSPSMAIGREQQLGQNRIKGPIYKYTSAQGSGEITSNLA